MNTVHIRTKCGKKKQIRRTKDKELDPRELVLGSYNV